MGFNGIIMGFYLGFHGIIIHLMDPCVHSAEKLCPLNRLQTQPYTTKWRLNLNQPPLLQNGLGVFMVDQKPMSVTTKWLCVPIL